MASSQAQETQEILESRPETRELRFHFANPDALEAGLRRARREPWVFSCRIDPNRQELVVRPVGDRDRRPELRVLQGGRA